MKSLTSTAPTYWRQTHIFLQPLNDYNRVFVVYEDVGVLKREHWASGEPKAKLFMGLCAEGRLRDRSQYGMTDFENNHLGLPAYNIRCIN